VDERTKRGDGTDAEAGRYRDVEWNWLEHSLVLAGDDDDSLGGGIEFVVEVGCESFQVGAEAFESRAARAVAIDGLVEFAPELLPRRSTGSAVLLTRRAPLGSPGLGRREPSWSGALRPPIEGDRQERRLG
jgi:hypothetical protein